MLKLNLQYFAEGVEIEYDGETSNLPIGKQARFACKDKSMPSDIVIKNKGVGEISGVTVTKDKVLEGETFYGSNGLEEGTMPNNGYIDGDYGATLDLNFTELLLNGAYRGSVTIYPQEVTIVPSDNNQEISPAEGCVFGKIKVEKIPPADEWDGTGVVIAPIEPEQPMTFTINGTSYRMDNRMTWYAWTRSDYNTDGFACANENDYVYEAESKNQVTDAKGNDVLGTTYIVEGGAYLIKEVATTDELAGTWVFNHNLYDVGSTSLKWKGLVQVPFSSGTYSNLEGMKIGNGTLSYCISVSQSKFVNNGASVYSSLNGGTWNTSVYKTITILSDDVTTDTSEWSVDDFKSWLKANATKQ